MITPMTSIQIPLRIAQATRLSFDASGERIIATCELRLKVGRRVEKCSMYREGD